MSIKDYQPTPEQLEGIKQHQKEFDERIERLKKKWDEEKAQRLESLKTKKTKTKK